MDSAPPNQYEQQLYSVFKTFDVADEDALDRSAALQLCDTLQLEDRGAALVDALFQSHERATFAQFRTALLAALAAAPPSDDDSSGREVAPKFVFGAKKYGRRSRPPRAAAGAPRPRGASESRLDGARARQRLRCKRSASAMESREDVPDDAPVDSPGLDHDRPVDRLRALELCRGLRMSGVDRHLVDRVFDDSAEEISVGEFFDRLNASLSGSIASLDGADPAPGGDAADVLAGDAVAEAWERAGVQRPRRLLAELGFAGAALRPHELERALDDELHALGAADEPDARVLLLLAAHVLARMRLDASARLLDVARAERNKLRDDLAEANRRARLLAQDVDENHARIEAELQAGLRQVEARHADAARTAAAEVSAERERAAALRLALAEEAARRSDAEARLRTETAALQDQIRELQEQAQQLEARAAAAEREAARAAHDAAQGARREAAAAERARAAGAAAAARLRELRAEGQRLRDRNDELAAALESGARCAAAAPCARSWREETANETPESSLVTQDRKLHLSEAVGKLQTIFDNERLPLQNENDCPECTSMRQTIATLRQAVHDLNAEVYADEVCTASGSSRRETGSQTELNCSGDVEELRKELADEEARHESEKQNLSSVIKELQSSLEQLKAEYDRCEEYWSCKLEDERDIFAEDQRAGDERLSELVSKIAEYERQFARPQALPPIAEGDALEQQFAELELEFSQHRAAADAQLAARAEEVKQLQRRVAELERCAAEPAGAERAQVGAPQRCVSRPPAGCGTELCALQTCGCACGACGAALARWRAACGAREAGALRARAARAERAAQRLHARLAAADLLVKDLYIENCRLAHVPPHPRLP